MNRHPKRRTEAFRSRNGLYRDEEQVPPEDRAALKSRDGG